MQRECNLLKKGFGIITAIIVVMAISGIVMLILMLASGRVKKTTDEYLNLQAKLLADSAVEYAIMRIEGFDRSGGGCLKQVNITANPFDINISIKYFMTQDLAASLPSCQSAILTPYITEYSANGTALLDIYVTYKDKTSNETIKIHKRTVQKP